MKVFQNEVRMGASVVLWVIYDLADRLIFVHRIIFGTYKLPIGTLCFKILSI
jgi:hypothetical protein